MADLLSKMPNIRARADEAAAFIVHSFKASLRPYALSLPLFLLLLFTKNWQVTDPASAILDAMPVIWLAVIGCHCLLYLLLEKHVSKPKVVRAPVATSCRERLTVISVTGAEMTRILECVLNKNALAKLPSDPMVPYPYDHDADTDDHQAFLLSKYRSVITRQAQFGEVPICIESDASLLIELRLVIAKWPREEAIRLYRRSEAEPINIRFVLENSSAATWPVPLDQAWV